MPRYIDADALQKSLQHIGTGSGKWGEAERMFIEAFSDYVGAFPTALEVVQCKDCKWRDESTCLIHGAIWEDNDFCSQGKRREDEY